MVLFCPRIQSEFIELYSFIHCGSNSPPPVGPPWDYSSEKDTLVIVTADGSFYKVCRQIYKITSKYMEKMVGVDALGMGYRAT